jgi:hypothetical protein
VLRSNQFPLQIVKRCRQPFDGDDWLFEIKHDGVRVLAIRDGGQRASSPGTTMTSAGGTST